MLSMKRPYVLMLASLLSGILACNIPSPGAQSGLVGDYVTPTVAEVGTNEGSEPVGVPILDPTNTTLPETPEEPYQETPSVTTIEDLMTQCPSPEEVAALDADLRISLASDPTAGTLVCTQGEGSVDMTLLQKNLYHAILAMQWIEFDEPLPWTEHSLYEWFVQAVDGVLVDQREELSFCCSDDGLIVLAADDGFFAAHTDRFLRDDPGQDDFPGVNGVDTLMTLLIHEARHNEGFGHRCVSGDDMLVSDMGSWSLVYYTYQWLADHTDPDFMRSSERNHAYYREMFNYEAHTTRVARFCGEPTVTPGPYLP